MCQRTVAFLGVLLFVAALTQTTWAAYVEVVRTTPDLLAYYRFEESGPGAAVDSSGNGRDGMYQGGILFARPGLSAELGFAAGFTNGSPDSSVAVPALGPGLNQFSIEAWVKPGSLTTFDSLYNVDGWPGGAFHGQFLSGGAFRHSINGGGPDDLDFGSGSLFPIGKWTHLVATYDQATGSTTVYANGQSLGTQAHGARPLANLSAGHIGAWNGNDREFDGLIDEVAFYSRALTSTEVQQHYDAAIPEPLSAYADAVKASSPLVYYRFEEPTDAALARDASGNGWNGSYQGGVTYGNPSASSALGSAAGFANGAPDGAVAVPALGSGLGQFSIEAWVNAGSYQTWDTLFNVDGWPGGAFHGQFLSSGAFRHTINGGGPDDLDFGSAAKFPLNQWTHLVATYDQATGDTVVYANAEMLGKLTHGAKPLVNLAAAHIGAWNGNDREFNGLIDEVAVYDHVLGPMEVRSHYLAAGIPLPPPPPAPGLIALWRFDGDLSDSSGHGNHGVAVGDPDPTAPGKVGAAMDLDGNDAVDISNLSTPSPARFTMSAWARTRDVDLGSQGIWHSDGWEAGDLHFLLESWGGSRPPGKTGLVADINSGATVKLNDALSPLNEDTWYYLAVSYDRDAADGQRMRLYIDGTQVASNNGSPGGVLPTLGEGSIGAWNNNSRFLNGLLDDMAIWDDALTGTQIKAIFNVADNPALNYGQADAARLFEVYAGELPDAAIGPLRWRKVDPGTLDGLPGDVVELGGGRFGLVLDPLGGGVAAAVIPEPSTFVLAALGLGVLALFACRRRGTARSNASA